MIPFVDLHAQYLSIKADIDKAIADVIAETAFIGGSRVSDFEAAFADYIGTKHTVACANGTDAIEILLQAMGIGPGDEVIVPAISWISTSEAVSTIGAKPVFVDIERDYFTIDPNKIEAAITNKTKAIIPVHLYGQPADLTAIKAIADKHGLFLLEDCAQAHGAELDGKRIGTWGDAASFSFYPGKNLGAYGDAGGMVTNVDEFANTARLISQHGQIKKHKHLIEGRNSRLDGLQAAILSAKLPYLEQWTEARIKVADRYDAGITHPNIKLPKRRANARHVYHLYVLRCDSRNELEEYLNGKGIQTAIHYPTALPFLDCYKGRGFSHDDFPVAAEYQGQILSLPMFAELSESQQDEVIVAINSF